MGCAKKLCENRKKTEWNGFYHQCQNQKDRVRLFILTLTAEKCVFSHCFMQNREEIESLKN